MTHVTLVAQLNTWGAVQAIEQKAQALRVTHCEVISQSETVDHETLTDFSLLADYSSIENVTLVSEIAGQTVGLFPTSMQQRVPLYTVALTVTEEQRKPILAVVKEHGGQIVHSQFNG